MNATARYGSSALGGTGLLVILGWLMSLLAGYLGKAGIDMPPEVQMAVVGLLTGPALRWLHDAGIDPGADAAAPEGPTASKPAKPTA